MISLTDFLLDRIAEDEAAVEPPGRGSAVPSRGAHAPAPGRWSAERIRAECQAKRRIVEQYDAAERISGNLDYDTRGMYEATELSVTYLAQVYSAHPDFDAAWAL